MFCAWKADTFLLPSFDQGPGTGSLLWLVPRSQLQRSSVLSFFCAADTELDGWLKSRHYCKVSTGMPELVHI